MLVLTGELETVTTLPAPEGPWGPVSPFSPFNVIVITSLSCIACSSSVILFWRDDIKFWSVAASWSVERNGMEFDPFSGRTPLSLRSTLRLSIGSAAKVVPF